MVYCWKCGTEATAEARYCAACGTKLRETESTTTQTSAEPVEQFWDCIESFVEGQIRSLDRSYTALETEHVPFMDRYVFALQLYVMGYVKGEVTALIICAAEDWEETDVEDLDLSSVYERIATMVDDREADFRAIVDPNTASQ